MARELARLFGVQSCRGRQFKGGPDSPDVLGLPGVHVECKRAEYLSLYNALEQAERDRDWEEIPMVCHRKNHRRWVVICYLDDLPALVKGLVECLG